MSNEVSTYVENLLTVLRADYPDWTFKRHKPRSEPEPDDMYITIGIVDFEADEDHEVFNRLDVKVVTAASVMLTVKDPTDVTYDNIYDIGTSLWAWSRNQLITGTGGVLEPDKIRMMMPTSRHGADYSRIQCVVTWKAPMSISPQYETQGPPTVDPLFGDPTFRPPIRNLDLEIQPQ